MTKAQIRLPGRGQADSATVRSALRDEADEIAARLAANKRESAHEQISAEGGTGDEAATGGRHGGYGGATRQEKRALQAASKTHNGTRGKHGERSSGAGTQ